MVERGPQFLIIASGETVLTTGHAIAESIALGAARLTVLVAVVVRTNPTS